MNRLKELRTRFRLKQKDVADRLNTTQQTVARWETGQTSIPVAQLKDLAILFACSVDELLGVELHPRQRDAAGFARDKQGASFGTLKVRLSFGDLEFPIDETEADRLLDRLRPGFELTGGEWLEVGTLNNRLVYLNPSHFAEVQLISDDTEAMPFFSSPEVYQALTKGVPPNRLGHIAAAERSEVIQRLTGKSADEELPPDCEDALIVEMQCVKVIYADGRTSTHYLTPGTVTEFVILSNNLDSVGANAFLRIFDEGPDCHLVNLSKIAAIEVPLEAYLQLLEDDS